MSGPKKEISPSFLARGKDGLFLWYKVIMDKEIWTVIITLLIAPNLAAIISHLIQKGTLNTIEKNTNSTLTAVTADKKTAEVKLEQNLLTQLESAKTRVADLEKQVALQTPVLGDTKK